MYHPLERSLIVCAIRDDAAALGMSSIGVQREIDIHIVVPIVSDSGWQGIDSRDLFANSLNRFIDYNVSRRPDNFEIGNAAVFFDSNFRQGRNFCAARNHRSWLRPFAIKTVMQHVTVPTGAR